MPIKEIDYNLVCLTMKNTVIPLSGVLCLLLIGCTGSFDKVQDAVNSAPDWYDNRKAEIRGGGYPALVEVPTLADADVPGRGLKMSREQIEALRSLFLNEPLAQLPDDDGARIASIADGIRAQFDTFDSTAHFLTDAEVEAIRQSFNIPRVTQGLKGQK